MEDIIKLFESRLEVKHKEREKQLDFVETQTRMNSDSLCSYERNAIDGFAAMLQLSAQIQELECVLSLLRAYCPNKPTA